MTDEQIANLRRLVHQRQGGMHPWPYSIMTGLLDEIERLKGIETAAKTYIATRRQIVDALNYGLILDPRGERAYHDSWTFLCNAVQEYEDQRRALEAT